MKDKGPGVNGTRALHLRQSLPRWPVAGEASAPGVPDVAAPTPRGNLRARKES